MSQTKKHQKIFLPAIFLSIFGVFFLLSGITITRNFSQSDSRPASGRLAQGNSLVVELDSSRIDPENEGKLIHFKGQLDALGSPEDPVFKLSLFGSVKLNRYVEMYQWTEEKKEGASPDGKKGPVRYNYTKIWSPNQIHSSRFKSSAHTNPEMPVLTDLFFSPDVRVGDFRIPSGLLAQLPAGTPISDDTLSALKPPRLNGKEPTIQDGIIYYGNSETPEVGDLRIKFSSANPGPVSILAAQSGNSLAPYKTEDGTIFFFLQTGDVPATGILDVREPFYSRNAFTGKLVGLLLLFVGFMALFTGFLLRDRVKGLKTKTIFAIVLTIVTFTILLFVS